MFDVGFSEMLVIGIVALLVIGPEKLPSVARTVGALLGRMQRYVNDVKADINREIELDELKKLQTTVQDAARSIETSVSDTMSTFQTQADELNKIASGDVAGLTATKPAETTPADAGTNGAATGATATLSSVATETTTAASTGVDAATAADVAPAPVAHPGAMATFAVAGAAPGPAAIAEASAARAAEGGAQNGSASGSQGTLLLESAPTNAPDVTAAAKPLPATA